MKVVSKYVLAAFEDNPSIQLYKTRGGDKYYEDI